MKKWFVVDTQGNKLGGPYKDKQEAERQEKELGGYALRLKVRTSKQAYVPRVKK